jgi:hypothetical protein
MTNWLTEVDIPKIGLALVDTKETKIIRSGGGIAGAAVGKVVGSVVNAIEVTRR